MGEYVNLVATVKKTDNLEIKVLKLLTNLKDLEGNEHRNKKSLGKKFLRCFKNIFCKILGEKYVSYT